MKNNFQVLAVTAPHWVKIPNESAQTSLNSSDPFSLQNAIRLAVSKAKDERSGWNKSNWKYSESYEKSVMLYQDFENQKTDYINRLQEIKPNLIIISTMTLGYAGAIKIANIAKHILGENVFIIVGGKHINETIYLQDGEIDLNESNPLFQIKNEIIPRVFNLVISGDGEEVIQYVGEIISECVNNDLCKTFFDHLHVLKNANGNWIIGYLDSGGNIEYLNNNTMVDQDNMPFPSQFFIPKSSFSVFETDRTFHSYSYLSKGCFNNCFFCSERVSINGKFQQTSTAPDRLTKQFEIFKKYGEENNYRASTFIEDSILLGGDIKLLERFGDLLKINNLNIPFGGQYTIDLLLNSDHQQTLSKLSKLGLSYIFIGVETGNQEIAKRMSKNFNNKVFWITKIESVINFLSSINVNCGFSLLFGLGEDHSDRIKILNQILQWQIMYSQPKIVSLNLATIHPLRTTKNLNYIDWGTDDESIYLELFTEIFGEASERYCINDFSIGSLDELQEIKSIYQQINGKY